jgi:hypothetical protein
VICVTTILMINLAPNMLIINNLYLGLKIT